MNNRFVGKIFGVFFIFLMCNFSLASNLKEVIKKEFNISPEAFTNLVFRRFYFIERLKYPMDFILNSGLMKRGVYSGQSTDPFIISNTELPLASYSLKPLFLVWEDFVQYKNLKDQILVENFTKEIFVVSQKKDRFFGTKNLGAVKSSSNGLNRIESLFESLDSNISKKYKSDTKSGIEDLKPFVNADFIVSRYYHLKRVTPVLKLLEDMEMKKLLDFNFSYKVGEEKLTIDGSDFFQKHIISLIQLVNSNKSIGPIISTWHGFLRYKYMDNEASLKEFCIFIFILLSQEAENHKWGSFFEKKKHNLSRPLQDMPLEELLDILDILVDELPGFIERYELDGEMDWKKWGRKYWLLAPAAFAALCLKIYLNVQAGGAKVAPPLPPIVP